jgi:hypothetical protein
VLAGKVRCQQVTQHINLKPADNHTVCLPFAGAAWGQPAAITYFFLVFNLLVQQVLQAEAWASGFKSTEHVARHAAVPHPRSTSKHAEVTQDLLGSGLRFCSSMTCCFGVATLFEP